MRRPVVFGLLWAGLAVTRSLGRAGIPVTGLTWDEHDFGLRSRYLAERLLVPRRDEAVLDALRGLSGSEPQTPSAPGSRPILIPERDENVELVLRRWDEVRAIADVPLPDDAGIVHALRRKERLPEQAARANVPIPATRAPESEDDVREIDLRPPFLVKPVEGQDFAFTFGEKLFVARDLDELLVAWRRARDAGFETVVQELVPKADEKIYSLLTYIGRDGEPLASVVGRKVRQGPLRFGTSAIFEVAYEQQVLDDGVRLLLSSGYRGFAQVEFAHDARDGDFKLLEVNTRLPMWAGIAMRPHFDMARIAYADLAGESVEPIGVLREPATWIYAAKDVWVSLQMARRRELALRDFLAQYARRAKVRSVLAADDPAPALASLGYLKSRVSAKEGEDGALPRTPRASSR